jgi:cobalt-zinc-cadmium efflux system outer membrane protein
MRIRVVLPASVACALVLLPGIPARGLSLEEALARAGQSRFEIAAISREMAAGEGRAEQASVGPATELDLETRGDFEESKAELIFVHERGGKRGARVAAARAELAALGAQDQVVRLDVGREVRAAYTAVLAAEESLRLTEEAHALARALADTVAEKVRAGAASPIEETRAAVRLHGVAAQVERARRDVALARADLALAIGDGGVRKEPLEGRLSEDTGTLPDPAAAAARLAASPDLKRLEQEVLVRRSVVAAEQTRSSRDLAWRVAANHSTLDDDEVWVSAGLTIPLGAPRNSGALSAAAAEVQRAELEHVAAARRRAGEWERASTSVQAAAREAAILRDEVLAGASQAFATVQEGYRLGKFPYLDVLDASQVLLDARLQYTAALAALAQARIDTDRLLGATGLPATTESR